MPTISQLLEQCEMIAIARCRLQSSLQPYSLSSTPHLLLCATSFFISAPTCQGLLAAAGTHTHTHTHQIFGHLFIYFHSCIFIKITKSKKKAEVECKNGKKRARNLRQRGMTESVRTTERCVLELEKLQQLVCLEVNQRTESSWNDVCVQEICDTNFLCTFFWCWFRTNCDTF